MKWIGIDLGSSSIKGAILDVASGRIGNAARAEFPAPIPGLPAGCFEIDARQAVEAASAVLKELLGQSPDCAGILSCSQMGGVILVDGEGRSLSNYLSWRDQRTVAGDSSPARPARSRLEEKLGPGILTQLGRESKPGAMLSLLDWLKEHGRLPARAVPLGLGEFVVAQWTGAAPVVEPTAALGTLDLRSMDWHREALAALCLSDLAWPSVLPYTKPAGTLSWNRRDIPVYPSVGDQQAALAGALLEPGELSLNISTGSQVSRLTEHWEPGDYQTRPYFDGRFLNTLTHLPAGRSLQVLMDLLTELPRAAGAAPDDAWDQVFALAENAPDDTQFAVDLSFFAGPFGNQGSITGITTENLTAGRLFRAAFRSMARNYGVCAARLCPNRDWTSLVFSGGLVRKSALLREMILRELRGESFRVAASTEDTLAGLMALGSRIPRDP